MASHNSFPGYVKLPDKKLYRDEIRLDFNARIVANEGDSRFQGFSLRLFTLKKSTGDSEEQPELSVSLTAEQWLDLIDAMRLEYEKAEEARKKLEGL